MMHKMMHIVTMMHTMIHTHNNAQNDAHIVTMAYTMIHIDEWKDFIRRNTLFLDKSSKLSQVFSKLEVPF